MVSSLNFQRYYSASLLCHRVSQLGLYILGSWLVYDDLTDVIRVTVSTGAQRNSRHRGTVGTEEQWAQRNRGTEEQQAQRHRGTVGTEDQWAQRNRGTVGTEEQRNSGHRGTVGTEAQRNSRHKSRNRRTVGTAERQQYVINPSRLVVVIYLFIYYYFLKVIGTVERSLTNEPQSYIKRPRFLRFIFFHCRIGIPS